MYLPPPVVRAYRGLEKRFLERFYAEFIILGSYRYGLFPDGDHTIGGWRGRGGGGLGWMRTRSADAYIGLHRTFKNHGSSLLKDWSGRYFGVLTAACLGCVSATKTCLYPQK